MRNHENDLTISRLAYILNLLWYVGDFTILIDSEIYNVVNRNIKIGKLEENNIFNTNTVNEFQYIIGAWATDKNNRLQHYLTHKTQDDCYLWGADQRTKGFTINLNLLWKNNPVIYAETKNCYKNLLKLEERGTFNVKILFSNNEKSYEIIITNVGLNEIVFKKYGIRDVDDTFFISLFIGFNSKVCGIDEIEPVIQRIYLERQRENYNPVLVVGSEKKDKGTLGYLRSQNVKIMMRKNANITR